jgi:2-polyprenyl-3-methyl-5-hydroxy-6-metoxy-1,4-benzoquinol methylase
MSIIYMHHPFHNCVSTHNTQEDGNAKREDHKVLQGKKILDVGCGAGVLSEVNSASALSCVCVKLTRV